LHVETGGISGTETVTIHAQPIVGEHAPRIGDTSLLNWPQRCVEHAGAKYNTTATVFTSNLTTCVAHELLFSIGNTDGGNLFGNIACTAGWSSFALVWVATTRF
jgi:hypothetical protein